jgi:predicted secreted protein
MAAIKGRAVIVQRNSVTVAGCRTKGLSIAGSSIDVTTDDDDGIRKLLDQPGQLDVSISVAGILTSDALRQEALQTSDRTQTTTFRMPDGWVGSPSMSLMSGNFFLAGYSESAEYQGAVTFEATFESAGAVTLS